MHPLRQQLPSQPSLRQSQLCMRVDLNVDVDVDEDVIVNEDRDSDDEILLYWHR